MKTWEGDKQTDTDQKVKFLKTDGQNGTVISHTNQTHQENHEHPVDGGTRAWMIMVGSFFCNGILFGVINSYGVLYQEMFHILKEDNMLNAPGNAALPGSLAMGMTFFISPVSGILTDYIGIRRTTFFGGLIAAGGMFLSSFCTHNLIAFCFTYGIMYGLGGALAYTPSLAVLGHYFKKYIGIVNGVVTAGSSIFTITMPYVLDKLLSNLGLEWTLRTLALLMSLIMGIAILFKPVKKTASITKVSVKDIFNMSVIRNKKYIIWTTVIGLCLFGYFVPYVYMINFVTTSFPKNVDKNLPVSCIAIMSGVSRLVFGYIIDRFKVNKILLQQLSFLTLGILTILLPFSHHTFPMLLIICLGMGITDGCFITLLGPIAFELCGRDGGTQAIGFLLGVCSIPLTLGPYIAGVILDHQQSYTLPFILAGLNPAIGSFGMLAIMLVNNKYTNKNIEETTQQEPLNLQKETSGITDLSERQAARADDQL